MNIILFPGLVNFISTDLDYGDHKGGRARESAGQEYQAGDLVNGKHNLTENWK